MKPMREREGGRAESPFQLDTGICLVLSIRDGFGRLMSYINLKIYVLLSINLRVKFSNAQQSEQFPVLLCRKQD